MGADSKKKILVVGGPTGVGKTEYAIELALALEGEIVSADSMQIYKYMNIGSAKPTAEEGAAVPHHLIDSVNPSAAFSVAEYQKMARNAIDDIDGRGKIPIVCGGTGLYINSIMYNMDFSTESENTEFRQWAEGQAQAHGSEFLHSLLAEKDPAAAERIHPNNKKKLIRALEILEGNGGRPLKEFASIPEERLYDVVLIGLMRPRNLLYDRINLRVDKMIDAGLVEEVKALTEAGLTRENISMFGIGYKEVISYMDGEIGLADAIDLIKKRSRHLAKKQMTWFKRYGDIKWFDLSSEPKENIVKNIVCYVRQRWNQDGTEC